jgi:hypothetical protein
MEGAAERDGGVGGVDPLSLHRRELTTLGRCPCCAEHVGALQVLRGRPCSHCGTDLSRTGLCSPDEIVARLRERWGKWRYVAFPLIAVATAVAGFVPLLGGLVRLVGMVIIHLVLVRRPLRWLSMRRRLTTKTTLRLYLAALALLGLLADALAAPLFGVNALVSGGISVLIAVIYAEGSLAFICGRMNAEARGAALAWWEWAVPGVLLFVMISCTVALVAVIAGMVKLMTMLPGIVTSLTGWFST